MVALLCGREARRRHAPGELGRRSAQCIRGRVASSNEGFEAVTDKSQTTDTYNPRSHWSGEELERTLKANKRRIADVQRELQKLQESDFAIRAEIARRTAT